MMQCPVDLSLYGCALFSANNFKVAVLILYSFYLCIYFLETLFVDVVGPMASPRDERRPGVPVHTLVLPQYLPEMILVYRRVLYEQWQPHKMKEGRVLLRHDGPGGLAGLEREKHDPPSPPPPRPGLSGVKTKGRAEYQAPSFWDVQIRLERHTQNPAVCVSVSVRG